MTRKEHILLSLIWFTGLIIVAGMSGYGGFQQGKLNGCKQVVWLTVTSMFGPPPTPEDFKRGDDNIAESCKKVLK